MRVLVTYATAHGSTRGVAHRIADRIAARGHEVAVRPVDAVDSFEGLDAAIVGSAIHDGRWLPGAADLVTRESRDLATRLSWFFSVSLLGDDESAFTATVARLMRRARDRSNHNLPYPEVVQPRDHRWFAGAIQRDHWPTAGRLFFTMMLGRYGDHRDWNHIDTWADSIADGLESTAPSPSGRERMART